MTINEIKELTKYLSEEEIEKIKEEIKSKETILKSGNISDEELVNVLNSFFSILVIEKTLEKEIDEVEDIRAELEEELVASYNMYDQYMAQYKGEDKKKKKKKNWLLNFFALSEDIRGKKEGIGVSSKTISSMQKEINDLKEKKSDSNLKDVVDGKDYEKYDDFCNCPHHHHHPHHHLDGLLRELGMEPRHRHPENRGHRHDREKGLSPRNDLDDHAKKRNNEGIDYNKNVDKFKDKATDPKTLKNHTVRKI